MFSVESAALSTYLVYTAIRSNFDSGVRSPEPLNAAWGLRSKLVLSTSGRPAVPPPPATPVELVDVGDPDTVACSDGNAGTFQESDDTKGVHAD